MFDHAEVNLAPNLPNTLNPAVRLPLLDEFNTLPFKGSLGIFRTWVPSRFGGELEIGCDQKGAKIVVTCKGKPLVDAAGNPVPKGPVVKGTIPNGQFGWFDIAVGGVSGTYFMWARFTEIGVARDGSSKSADPLIPWNFWYFPYARKMQPYSAWGSTHLKPCTKYETAFSKSGVQKWELDHHNDPKDVLPGWVGHCHNSAPASILFKSPDPAGKTVRGVQFTCEELKFFAAEYVGRVGSDTCPWSLPGTGSMGRQGFFQEHKPEDNPKRFGTLIADFHKAIRNLLLIDQKAGWMDLRDASGAHHEEVWNQAIYKYVSRMWETTPHGDWHDIQVETTLFGNDDVMPSSFDSSGLPAKIEATGPKGAPKDAVLDSSPTAIYRNEILRCRMIFRPDGEINATHDKNEWQSAKSTPRPGRAVASLHAPRFLFVPLKPPVKNPDPDGNVLIDLKDIPSLLELRDIYK